MKEALAAMQGALIVLNKLATDLALENEVQRAVIAKLFAELAHSSSDPDAKLDRMSTELQGMVHGMVVGRTGEAPQVITAKSEKILERAKLLFDAMPRRDRN